MGERDGGKLKQKKKKKNKEKKKEPSIPNHQHFVITNRTKITLMMKRPCNILHHLCMFFEGCLKKNNNKKKN